MSRASAETLNQFMQRRGIAPVAGGAENFLANFRQHFTAIELCLTNGLRTPALVLIYSTIDALAGAARPAHVPSQTRRDFIAWAEGDMRCRARLDIRGLDLYAARCSVLHAHSQSSNLSNSGKAKGLIYAWGDRDPAPANDLLRQLRLDSEAHMIRIETLFDALCNGFETLCQRAAEDDALSSLLVHRAGKIFANRATFP